MKSPLFLTTTLTALLVTSTACGPSDAIADGIRPPDVADRLLLFITPAAPATAEVLGGG